MKNLLPWLFTAVLAISLTLITSMAFPGNVVLNPGTNSLEIVQNHPEKLVVSSEFSSFSFQEMKTPNGIFIRIEVPGYVRSGAVGTAELPCDSRFIEVPAGAQVSVNILHSVVREYRLADLGISHQIYPKQPPIPKTGEMAEFVYNAAAYSSGFYANQMPVSVEILGSMRGVNIGRLDVSPIQYNPGENTIRVYEELEYEVVFEHADQALTQNLKQTYYSPCFQSFFHQLLNYRDAETSSRDTISRYPVKYVIISDPMFEAQLQPFIEWKTRKGFNVVEAYTDDPNVGTTTFQIKEFLQDMYDNATPEDPAPTFVLFVGDIAQVPTFTGQAAGHVTDLYYVEYTGDDFPEIYYGRFSAQNTSQLQPQIDKTLMYEQYTMPDPSYLEEVVMIAGVDGTYGPIHGNGQINYGTTNYFNEDHDLLSHTYLYPESGSSSAAIRQNISDGVGYANYTAHGSPSGWADPEFSVSQIPALQNDGKYGLLIGNCCSTSEYQVNECFGEALLRAENKGALGYIGASNSTYWDEDYYFGVGVGAIAGTPPPYEETSLGNYDRAFHDHGEDYADWYVTVDQMIFAGNLAVTLGSQSMATYYWEAYCLMGDPSLMVYLGVPDVMTVTYDPLIPLGGGSFEVTAVPHAYVALSKDGVLLGAALADADGLAVVPVTGAVDPGDAEVVATAQNYQPFIGTVLIANPEGPYVTLNEMLLDDMTLGNGNGSADCGEDVLFDAELKNWGNAEATGVTAQLLAQDTSWIMISDDYQEFGTIDSQDSVMQTGAYQVYVKDSVPDQAVVGFDLLIQDAGRETWSSTFTIKLNAPVLTAGNITIDDTESGNGNGRLDPGETVDLYLAASNTGHCDAYDAVTTLSSGSEYITVNAASSQMDTLVCGNTYSLYFNLTVSEEATIGSYADLLFLLQAMPYSTTKEVLLPVGLVIEDFETGDFSSFGWLTSGTMPWVVTASDSYEGDYSASSGDITDNQTSELYLDMEVFTADSISFFRKVSCEDDPNGTDYDWLAFYIDDVEMDRWDGELNWERMVYPVAEGSHTFKWVYNKDYSVSSGADGAWIDYIIFPGVSDYVAVNENVNTLGTHLNVYPNPAGNRVFVSFNLEESTDVSLRVIDLAGRQLSTPLKNVSMGAGYQTQTINLDNIPSGAYFMVLETGTMKYTKKLIKK